MKTSTNNFDTGMLEPNMNYSQRFYNRGEYIYFSIN